MIGWSRDSDTLGMYESIAPQKFNIIKISIELHFILSSFHKNSIDYKGMYIFVLTNVDRDVYALIICTWLEPSNYLMITFE
jgi:hypothetical protein